MAEALGSTRKRTIKSEEEEGRIEWGGIETERKEDCGIETVKGTDLEPGSRRKGD